MFGHAHASGVLHLSHNLGATRVVCNQYPNSQLCQKASKNFCKKLQIFFLLSPKLYGAQSPDNAAHKKRYLPSLVDKICWSNRYPVRRNSGCWSLWLPRCLPAHFGTYAGWDSITGSVSEALVPSFWSYPPTMSAIQLYPGLRVHQNPSFWRPTFS